MTYIGDDSDTLEKRDLERDPSSRFRLSVVVPARDAEQDLPHCLDALASSDLPREEWELIVIDDSLGRGPAYARNRGVESASAPVVAFIDSDVMVHSDALRRMLSRLESSDTAAVFGSYDSSPLARGLVSQYRNLLHHFIHQTAGGEVETFWAGCGAVKKSVLLQIGTFDERRYTRPEIEDVELGYRLRDAGCRIMLDPEVQCTHRKRWPLVGMIVSDFSRRGVPWARLLAERGMLTAPRGLSLGKTEQVSAATAIAFLVSASVAIISENSTWLVLSVGAIAGFLFANREFFRWLARSKGTGLTLASVPLHLLYNVVAVAALAWGALEHALRAARPPPVRSSRTPD